MKLLQNLMSSAGGQVIDDDIISSDTETLILLLNNLQKTRKEEQSKKLLNEIKVSFEEHGLLEEEDSLLFHSDLQDTGVQINAEELKYNLDFLI
ncbi:MAG: hypothetical protein EZS28_022375 [Streblomastix strix]|uniref:Uncharacterized protein n=1 Tax=Streblomastix strix TaxID=222440 RepID=A0A5J4VHK6_9EUKA|nr:MAG: hypothetical protein EZS28_022375 [Streblomastix strix]